MASHLAVFATLALAANASAPEPLDAVAEGYVKLVLAVGRHAPNYVDSYFGPPQWQAEAERAGKRPLAELGAEAGRLLEAARAVQVDPGDRVHTLRRDYLLGQLGAVSTYLRILGGARLSFDEEARELYGVNPPPSDLRTFESLQAGLDRLLPGEGALPERFQAWVKRLAIPREKIEAVMRAALEEARRRTLPHVALPPGERCALSVVSGKTWFAYNWYRGQAQSLIEVNADGPLRAFGAVNLMAHEGYPGHHVAHALREARLANGRHEVEHTVTPLYSPISLVDEGSAQAGVDLVFPEAERLPFERDVIFPLAGVDPSEAPRAAEVRRLLRDVRRANQELARRYLDGTMTAAQVTRWLVSFALLTPEEAARWLRAREKNRSYVVGYDYGEELVNGWLDARAGADPEARWAAFVDLIGSPRLPAALLERPAR